MWRRQQEVEEALEVLEHAEDDPIATRAAE